MPVKNGSIRLSVAEFGKAIGKTSGWVNVYVGRGQIKKDDGLIDIKDPVNEKFIKVQKNKGVYFDINKINGPAPKSDPKNKNKGSKPKSQVKAQTAKPKQSYELEQTEADTLEVQKKKAELKRLKAQTRNEEIKAAKNEGKLIPIQEVETLFIYAIEGFHSHYQQEVDSILNTITGSVDLSHERFVELRKDIKNTLTSLYNETRAELLDGVKNLSEQYSEVRGKGEHK